MKTSTGRELALRWGLGAAALLAAVLGLVGFADHLPHQENYGSTSPFDVVYYTLQLFLLDSAPLQQPSDIPAELEIARFLAPLTTAVTLGATVKKVYDSTYRAVRARTLNDHTVIVGGGTAALLIARDVIAEGRTCVVIGTAEDPHVDADGVLRIAGDPRQDAVLREARVDRAHEVIVTGDSTRSTDVAAALRTVLTDAGTSPPCYLEMASPALAVALVAHELSTGSGVRFEFFDPIDRAARRLLDGRLPAAPEGVVLLVGDGPLRDAVARDHHRRGLSPDRLIPWSTQQALGSATPPPETAVVIVAVTDDALAVQLGLTLVGRMRDRHVDVVVATTSSTALGSAITGDEVASGIGSARLLLFNTNDEIYRLRSLRNGIYLDLARATHESYLAHVAPGSTSSTVSWEDLPEERQRANIAQAWSIGQKLRSEGLVVVPSDGTPNTFDFQGNEIDRLARDEHDRWMKERTREGWTFGSPRDDAQKHHPNLVPWERLDPGAKQKDVDAIRAVPGNLARVGLHILRTRP